MAKNLVIVESPGKVKKIQSFLGSEFRVAASYGHIRDLDKGNKGIDKENDFTPSYIVSSDKKDVVKGIKKLADKIPGGCGCQKRKNALNKLIPYKNK